MKITIGIPAYNEEKNIAGIISKLKKYTDSIIVCDDGSSDLTGDISEQLGAIVIKHSKNRGYGAAINSLFLKAKELESDVFLTLDADGQHRVEDIPIVTDPIIKNEVDLVIGSRFLDTKSEEMPNYRKVGIKIITKTYFLTRIFHHILFVPSELIWLSSSKETAVKIFFNKSSSFDLL